MVKTNPHFLLDMSFANCQGDGVTNDQIKIEIAKLMGWAKCACGDPNCGAWFAPGAGENDPSLGVPNYPTSLDACRSFEDSLNAEQQMEYSGIVHELVHSPRHWKHVNFDLIHTSALQRCEAFLRLHGKWIES